jgi:uncharacterized protein (TIGR03437 family)
MHPRFFSPVNHFPQGQSFCSETGDTSRFFLDVSGGKTMTRVSLSSAFLAVPLTLLLISVPLAAQAPVISPGGVINGADYTAEFAPGSLISVFGTGLAPTSASAPSFPLPTSLSGAYLEILDGSTILQAPLFYVSPGLINAQLPFDLTSSTPSVRVRNASGVSAAVAIQVQPSAPKLLTLDMTGKGAPIMLHSDYRLVTANAPAAPGEIVILYLTGLGAVFPASGAGQAAGDGSAGNPLNLVTADVSVIVGNQCGDVLFAGLTPYYAGLYQLNIRLPEVLLPGSPAFVVMGGGKASQANVALPLSSDWKSVGSASLTAAGGQLTAPGFSLTAGSGALSSSSLVTVYSSSVPLSAAADQYRASPRYTVSGMPSATAGNLTLTLDLTGTTSADSTLVRLEWLGVSPPGAVFLPATVANGKATVTIPGISGLPSATASAITAKALQPADAIPDTTPSFTIWAVSGFRAVESSNKHFHIIYPVTQAASGAPEEMADALETAYTYIDQTIGLHWLSGKRPRNSTGSWPIQVNIEYFSGRRADRWGEEGSTALGVQRQGLNLNARWLDDSKYWPYARVTAAHELFHLMQNLWDPASAPSKWLWMEEAMSTWLEKRLFKGSSYIPTTLHQDPIDPTSVINYDFFENHGLEWAPQTTLFSNGNAEQVQNHGYGASMFLEYLANKYGVTMLATLADTMSVRATGLTSASLYSPVEAIAGVATNLSSDWRLFSENVMAGNVYGGSPAFPSPSELITLVREVYNFQSSSDQGTTFTRAMPDLSARVYEVRIAKPGWASNTTLSLALTDPGGEAEAILYKVKGTTLTKVAVFRSSYDLNNAENLSSNGESLIVMVTNGRAVKPYTGTTTIALDVRLNSMLGKLKSALRTTAQLNAAITLRYSNGKTFTTDSVVVQPAFWIPYMAGAGHPCSNDTTIAWTGQNFQLVGQCVYHNPPNAWYDYRYNVTGSMNSTGTAISTATFSDVDTDASGGKVTRSFTVQNIPLTQTTCDFNFRDSSSTLSSRISGIVYSHREATPSATDDFDFMSIDWTKSVSVNAFFYCK